MNIRRKLTIWTLILVLSQLIISCSKSDDEESVPKYVGTWEGTWFSDDYGENVTQTLVLQKESFSTEISIPHGNTNLPVIKCEGSFIVTDNTLAAQITKYGKLNESFQMVFYDDSNSNFTNLVIENLNVHPGIVGTFFIDGNTLTVRVDMDGDGSVSGDEGLFVFQEVS